MRAANSTIENVSGLSSSAPAEMMKILSGSGMMGTKAGMKTVNSPYS